MDWISQFPGLSRLEETIRGRLLRESAVISGMANPAKVLNFFDFAGTWDPSLAFVVGGALPVIGTARADVLLFVVALVAGILARRRIMALSSKESATPLSPR